MMPRMLESPQNRLRAFDTNMEKLKGKNALIEFGCFGTRSRAQVKYLCDYRPVIQVPLTIDI